MCCSRPRPPDRIREAPGGLYPYAIAADSERFLDANTVRYFDFVTRRVPLMGFWPAGTTRAHVEAHVLEAFTKLKEQTFQPPPKGSWEKTRITKSGDGDLLFGRGHRRGIGWALAGDIHHEIRARRAVHPSHQPCAAV